MIWVVGIAGFICGFGGGIALLNRWLKERSRKELMQDKSLHRTYGVFVWAVAAITAAAAIEIYRRYF